MKTYVRSNTLSHFHFETFFFLSPFDLDILTSSGVERAFANVDIDKQKYH